MKVSHEWKLHNLFHDKFQNYFFGEMSYKVLKINIDSVQKQTNKKKRFLELTQQNYTLLV